MNSYAHNVAVMAQRIEPADSLDFFPTPPWGTRTFARHVLPVLWPWPDACKASAWDPACGQGHMALALAEDFARVEASDIFDYGFGGVSDFLHPDLAPPDADWIVTNPPFNLAEEFILKALKLARRGVAMLCRANFAEGQGRYTRLFSRRPPQIEAIFVDRLPMHRGRWVIDGSSATAYAWFCWLNAPPHDWGAPRRMWIPPSRKALSMPGDWLTYGGCQDLPKHHPAMRLMRGEAPAAETDPLAAVRAQLERLL